MPSLDGLRAISILLVVLGHASGTKGLPLIDPGLGDYAHLGVVVFFVISGFLITRLMVGEQETNGSVSLRLFYARRTLRLFPASYAYVLCLYILGVAGVLSLRSSDYWHAASYTVNYLPNASWEIGHLWSLSVEEQFYLLWPCAFIALGMRRAFWVAGSVLLLGPVARSLGWLFLRGTPFYELPMFPMVADSLATGCLLTASAGWLEKQNWYLRLFRPIYSLGLVGLILALNRYMGHTVVAVFGSSVVNICIAVLIHRMIYCSSGTFGRILNSKPVAFVGVLSYSIYLWQQPFLNRGSSAWVCGFPQNLGLAAAAALASYFLLEKPQQRLRHRLRAIRRSESPGFGS